MQQLIGFFCLFYKLALLPKWPIFPADCWHIEHTAFNTKMQLKQQPMVQQAVNLTGLSSDYPVLIFSIVPIVYFLTYFLTVPKLCLCISALTKHMYSAVSGHIFMFAHYRDLKLLFTHYPPCPFNLPEQYFLFYSHAISHQLPIQRSLYKYPFLTHVKYW